MSEAQDPSSVDMIRWTFVANPENREAIEAYLVDLGLDVQVVGDSQFHVTWEEPERDMADVTSELWDLNEEPFEINQEEFHRIGNFLIHPEEADGDEAKAA